MKFAITFQHASQAKLSLKIVTLFNTVFIENKIEEFKKNVADILSTPSRQSASPLKSKERNDNWIK